MQGDSDEHDSGKIRRAVKRLDARSSIGAVRQHSPRWRRGGRNCQSAARRCQCTARHCQSAVRHCWISIRTHAGQLRAVAGSICAVAGSICVVAGFAFAPMLVLFATLLVLFAPMLVLFAPMLVAVRDVAGSVRIDAGSVRADAGFHSRRCWFHSRRCWFYSRRCWFHSHRCWFHWRRCWFHSCRCWFDSAPLPEILRRTNFDLNISVADPRHHRQPLAFEFPDACFTDRPFMAPTSPFACQIACDRASGRRSFADEHPAQVPHRPRPESPLPRQQGRSVVQTSPTHMFFQSPWRPTKASAHRSEFCRGTF